MSEFEAIWKTLSAINVNEFVQEKMGLKYLSWASAWEAVMGAYPAAEFEVLEPVTYEDGTVEVWTAVTINGLTRKMWLPVMDHKNKAIPHPNSRQVSDNRMRCLVKNLAMFGLGLYVYRGEDIPKAEKVANAEEEIQDAIKQINFCNEEQTIRNNFKRLASGKPKDSDFIKRLTQACIDRVAEIKANPEV